MIDRDSFAHAEKILTLIRLFLFIVVVVVVVVVVYVFFLFETRSICFYLPYFLILFIFIFSFLFKLLKIYSQMIYIKKLQLVEDQMKGLFVF